MAKIRIVSQAEQGVIIDISGCDTAEEARHFLASTLQVSSQFWQGLTVSLELGQLSLKPEELSAIVAILQEVGVRPQQIFAFDPTTLLSLKLSWMKPPAMEADGEPTTLRTELATTSCPSESSSAIEEADAETEIWKPHPADELSGFSRQESLENLQFESGCMPEERSTGSSVSVSTNPDSALVRLCLDGDGSVSTATDVACAPTRAGQAQARSVPERAPAVLYLRQTLRSGQAVSHRGDLVIVGDVNPGAEVMAEGDITVWGALRGIAHAGVGGNTRAEIRALKFAPIQLRIAHAIARSPDGANKLAGFSTKGPEVAKIVDGKIRISPSDPE